MASPFEASTNVGESLSLAVTRPSFLGPPPAVPSEQVPWHELPNDLLHLIYPKVGLSDRLSFSAVCKSWSLMKKERELPWLVLPHDPKCQELNFFNLSRGTDEKVKLPEPLRDAVFVGSTNGWLAFIKIDYNGLTTFAEDSELFLFNPVSRQLLKLPSIPETPCYHHWASKMDMQINYIYSIAISSSRLNESTMVSAIFGDGLELAVCKPGDEQWTIFTGNYDLKEYEKMMGSLVKDGANACYYNEALFRDNTLFVLSLVAPHEIGQAPHPDHHGIYYMGSLKLNFINVMPDLQAEEDVSSLCSECLLLPCELEDECASVGFVKLTLSVRDELLLAVQWVVWEEREQEEYLVSRHSTKRIAIFKVDVDGEGGARCSRLNDVGDQVVFLGGSGSRVVDSKDISGIRGNSVFFLEASASGSASEKGEDEELSYIYRDCGEYSLVNDKIVRSLPSCMESLDFLVDWFSPT